MSEMNGSAALFQLFYGPNAGYAEELYSLYLENPAAVDETTRAAFDRFKPYFPNGLGTSPAAYRTAPTETTATGQAVSAPLTAERINKIVSAARLTRLVRELGHLAAQIDPLGSPPPGDPALELETHDLQTEDLAALPASVVGGPCAEDAANALEALGRLRIAYSGSIGYEDDHIHVPEEREWLREAAESRRFFQGIDANIKRRTLERLTDVDTFEQYLETTFKGVKRFSIEGTDMVVPMLDVIIRDAASVKTHEVVMGMAHRGRLNVLTHILGKPYEAILSEFAHMTQTMDPSVAGGGTLGYSGDVKYHLGARRNYRDEAVEEMPITLTPNPSHLEFVNPVVTGRARAAQEKRTQPGAPQDNPKASLAILIHGDAAFPGQGIVAETLNLSQLKGYYVGGTIHIILNNQVGFTTDWQESRSTLYCSDLAKGFEIPILHVNADDPEACLAAARMAFAYREKFGKDFLIDLVGYRRYGHNEGDEPAFTQPRMYEVIRQHPRVRELWAKRLEEQAVVTRDEAEAMVKAVREKLHAAREASADYHAPAAHVRAVTGSGNETLATAVPAEALIALNEGLLARPNGFTTNAKLENMVFARRREAVKPEGAIDWGHAEALAFASILRDGTPIRLSGQDSERGTFAQRHLVLHDPTTGETFCPMQALPDAKASFAVYNSPLSENACVGFEYGYSMHAQGALVLWEGQFGDFCNGAQVIIDQFLVSGKAKWQQTPSLVLLLPHGYEGQGPEHSSARLERFLQLAADDNIRVANCTTPAQYFHLLRRQAALLETDPLPLVVLTPKSLLRYPPKEAFDRLKAAGMITTLNDLAEGVFHPVLDDVTAQTRRESVSRLILCSGKVYADLVKHPQFPTAEAIAVARVEQLYPFPEREITQIFGGYPNLREVVWLQEEPQNMGAWSFMAPRLQNLLDGKLPLRYEGRREASSTAEGSIGRHEGTQAYLLSRALSDAPSLKKTNGRSRVPVKA